MICLYKKIGFGVSACIFFLFFPIIPVKAAGWINTTSGSGGNFNGISFINAPSGIAVGNNGIAARTSDGGKTWASVNIGQSIHFYDVAMSSGTNGFAVGTSGNIYKSSDGGGTWTKQTSGTNEILYGVYFMPNTAIGWAVGGGGTLIKTINGGTNWTSLAAGVTSMLYDVYFIDQNIGWVVGENGSIYKTTNGGDNWTIQASNTTEMLFAVSFQTANSGYAVGQNRTVLKTTNGGATWIKITTNAVSPNIHFKGVWFLNSSIGFIAGTGGILIKSIDGGITWTLEASQTQKDFQDITGFSTNYVWAVGDSDTILIYDTVGPNTVTGISLSSGKDYTNDTTPTFTWTPAVDNMSSIGSYKIKIDQGEFTSIGNITTYTLPAALSESTHAITLKAVDSANNEGYVGGSSEYIFRVDITVPSVNAISPNSTVAGQPLLYSAIYNDDYFVTGCHFFVNGFDKGAMALGVRIATLTYTFSEAGSFPVHAECTDIAGNVGKGSDVQIVVNSGTEKPSIDSTVSPPANSNGNKPGSLIKLSCQANAGANSPCKTVYYYGSDQKRHSFPNEWIYFSWYNDFSTVKEVDNSFISSIPLGKNVQYRPGVKLVKFMTVNKVYAVSKNGILRWVKTEELARSLYGTDWNKKIDDIADVFYLDYAFGADISRGEDFNIENEKTAVGNIDLNLAL